MSGDLGTRARNLPRIADVAARAGVSTATVDRVVNGREGVRPATAQRVLRAAAELDYSVDPALAATAPSRPMRLAFLLPAGTNRYLSHLGRLIGTSGDLFASFRMQARVEFVDGFKPELLARHLRKTAREVDGIALMALEHPAVREAVDGLVERGVPAVTLISDVANSRRAAYIGLDNRAAGRTAAFLIARFVGRRSGPGPKLALIAGSRSYRAHEEREMGFLSFVEQFPAGIEVLGLREGHDDVARNYRQAKMLLAQHPDVAGLYNIGGAPEGIARALKEAGRDQDVVFVGHGLTPETRPLLIDGTMDAVITQNPHGMIVDCATVFANLRDGRVPTQGLERPRSEIVLRENLP